MRRIESNFAPFPVTPAALFEPIAIAVEPCERETASSDYTYRSPRSGLQRSYDAHGHQSRWAIGVGDAYPKLAKFTGRIDLVVKPVDARIDDDSNLRSVKSQTRKAQGRSYTEVVGPLQHSLPDGTGEDLRFRRGDVGHDMGQWLVRRSPI